jgi:hypothetical protein
MTDHVDEKIIETGTPISFLELAYVNEDTRPSGERRDKPVSLSVIPLCEPALLIHQISVRLTK